jgi:hypothetical protein
MANFLVDQRPHVLAGFNLKTVLRDEFLHRPRAFLGLSSEKAFENVVVATFFLRVEKMDFKPLVRALRLHLLIEHNVCCLEI